MSNYNNIIIILAAVYIAERLELQGNFFEPQNPRFIIESGFKSRAGYNGARTVSGYSSSILHETLSFQSSWGQ